MERRLAAILAADVVGYSRLMGEDEAGTLERLKACRARLIDPAIAKYHGRIVKLMGDGALVEFASVVDAVQCAAAIQRAMAGHEPEVAEARRIRFRIGVNLGDVIVEGDDLYGDGVNIAARLQTLAEPGGICVSGTAFDHARQKIDVGFVDLGERHLKNIAEPVRTYRVALETEAAGKVIAAPKRRPAKWVLGAAAALVAIAALAFLSWPRTPTQAERPAVAVLPFTNLSGDPAQDYFADGITEDLITDLAKLTGLDVIARNSVFAYRGKPVVVADIAHDLGVRYVVEGSVRRVGEQIRINAQLIDATTGNHVWADRFDRRAADVFAVQDQMRQELVKALGVAPSASESTRMARLPTANLEAYDYYLRGEQAARSGTRAQLRQALEFYAKAEALDPTFADAFAADARTSVFAWRNVYDDVLPTPVAKKRAYEMAGRALELDPRSSQPYATLAALQAVDKQYDQAIASASKAVGLGPGSVDAHIALGFVLSVAGRHADAAAAIGTAQRLDPNLSATDRQVAGLVFLLHGDPASAIETLEKSRAQAPGADDNHSLLAAAYAAAGRMEEARAAAAEAIRLGAISVESYRMELSYLRNGEDLETILGALRKAGFPQWPGGFQGDERDRLSAGDISRLVFGHTLHGKLNNGSPAIMQIDKDGNFIFRSPALLYGGRAYVENDRLCVQSESAGMGRPGCGPIYRRPAGEDLAFTYVHGSYLLYFSVAK